MIEDCRNDGKNDCGASLGDTDEVELEFYLTTPFASGMKMIFESH